MNLLTTYLLAASYLFMGANTHSHMYEPNASQTSDWLLFETLDLPISGPYYDVSFYQDNIVFLKPGEETMSLAPMVRPDPAYSQAFFANADIRCSPAALSFTSDYNKGYYTQSVVDNEQVYREKIFELSIQEEQASVLGQLSFTGHPSRNLHPAVSPDGSMMIFSSDRLPTSGGLDLFITQRTDNGWSEPRNLGASVNTSGHEWFPFLDNMNNLWFASSGHSGYGGFDIYVCPFKDQEWGAPRNLGEDINGPQNEWGFSIHPGKQVALFSRSWSGESRGMATMLTLNEEAVEAAGRNEAAVRNISLYLQGISDPAPESATSVRTEPETETIAEPEPEAEQETVPEPEPEIVTDPSGPVVFRIQIISSLYENSFPTVLIDGKSYSTYEYFYLGSFRITVGKFDSLEEANAFRLRCLDSGFKQAFVAAFRGGERETDPSVFKQ